MKTNPASKSLLISLAIVFGVLISVSVHSTAHAFSVSVGSQQMVMSASQRQNAGLSYVWPDGSMGALSINGSTIVCGPNGGAPNTQCFWTTNMNNWPSSISVINTTQNITEGGSNDFDRDYVGGGAIYYDSGSGILLQMYHGEYHYNGQTPVIDYAALGLVYSTDLGVTWHKLGEVISPQTTRTGNCQVDPGVGSLTPHGDGYLYAYYVDEASGCSDFTLAVARASISSLVAAARAGTPFTSGQGNLFEKYYNGGFSQPGVNDLANPQNGGGAFTPIFPNTILYTPAVAYDSYVGQYVLSYANGWNGINIAFSSDGITNWGSVTALTSGGTDPSGNNAYFYPTPFNTNGGDPETVGSSFYVYYVNPFGNWSATNLLRIPVTLAGGTGSNPPTTPPPTPAPTTGTDTTAPSVPTGVTAPAYSNTSIGVGWSASTDNVGVAGYKVYRNGTQLGTTANLGWLDTNLNAGTSYSYTVAAYDAAGNVSAQSTAVTGTTTGGSTAPVADTTPPSVPTGLSATAASPTQVNLSWNPSTDNVAVTGYKIYRNGSQIAGTTNPSYSDTGLAAATSYSYTIAAYDAAGNLSSQSGGVSVTTQSNAPATDTTPPSVPTDVQAPAYSNTSIGVGWDPSTDNVAVTGYKVYRNGSQLGTTPNTGWLDTNLNSGTTYNYTISAFDAAGNVSALSASVAGTTSGGTTTPPPTTPPPTTPPPTPTPTPTTSGNTITAASCNESDVSAVINGPSHNVANGDTIVIPAGTCTWNSPLTIPTGIGFTLKGTGTSNSTPSTFGAGTLSTTIIDNGGTGSPMISITGLTTSDPLMRISTMDIEPANAQLISPLNISGTCSSTTCPEFRIDNIGFGLTTPWREGNVGATGTALIRTDNVFGVIDHNTNPPGNYTELTSSNLSSYLGVGANGDNSWAQPDSEGTANAVYIENNQLYNEATVSETEFGAFGGGIGGERQVGRFNEINANAAYVSFSGHGLESDGRPRGLRQTEAYNNTITCVSGSCNTAVVSFRSGGTGYVFDNLITADAGTDFGPIFDMNVFRTVFTASPWGACGGSGSWDTNDGTVYYTGTVTSASNPSVSNSNWNLTMTDNSKNWTTNQFIPTGAPFSIYDVTKNWWGEITSNTNNTITAHDSIAVQSSYGFNVGDTYQILRATVCADQPGRGQGNYISGYAPTPVAPLNEALDPIYEWNDTINGSVYWVDSTQTARVIANRDWFAESLGQSAQSSSASPFNGTSGTGHGTLANRPTSCTAGVGYWATDQGNWNKSGLTGTGTGATYGGQGELYKCTSTNTWNLAYVPYTYPDPLITGAAAVTPPPITTPPPVTTPPAPTPASTLFTIGESVTVSSGPLNVRSTASTSGTAVGTETTGNIGTVTGGPTAANGYNWWQVKWNDGLSGWSVENYMAAAPVVTTPPPTPTPTTGTDTTPPSVPTNVQAPAYSNTSIGVTWTASTDNVGVVGYKVYRNGTLLGTDPNTGYLDTNLTPGTTYSYTVQAYDAAGNVSALSVAVSGTTSGGTTTPPPTPTPTSTPATGPDNTPPSTPTGLSVTTVSQSELRITWTASTDNVGVTGYNIYRNGALLGTTANATYLDTNLQTNTTYSYTVQALDAAGNASPQSKGASGTTGNVTTTPPPTPTSTTASGITSPLIESATVGSPFNYQITATNNPTAYYISGLPSGLSGNSAYGTISGIPTVAGTYSVTVGSTAPGSYVQAIMTLTVNGTATANSGITSPLIESATVGSPFNYQITATNNPTAYYISGLPSGLSGNSAYGTISGIPTVAGTYSVTVGSTAPGSYVQAIMTLTVNGAGTTPPPTPTPTIPTVLPTSTAGLENLIAQLEAELTALQSQSNGGGSGGTTPTKTTPGPTTYVFTRNLSVGSSGADVTELQTVIIQDNAGPAAQALAAVGPTGTFGTLTKNALIELQKSLGVPATGFFGPLTRSKVGGGE